MQNEFLPYDRALKLKQLGFDEPCFVLYKASNNNQLAYAPHGITTNSQLSQGDPNNIAAPLFQQAFRWFREKHGIMHRLTSYAFGYQIHLDNTADFDFEFVDRRYDSGIDYKTYEEAELACLDKLIEIVTKQQEQ
jgi:hypothetical protein